MCADKEIKSTIEFKTVNSCGAPEKAKDIILSKGPEPEKPSETPGTGEGEGDEGGNSQTPGTETGNN